MSDQSPLAQADSRSLDALYGEDPLNLTDSDVDRIVADLREKRRLWAREESESQAAGRKRRPSVYKDKPEKGKLSLDELGIDLSKIGLD